MTNRRETTVPESLRDWAASHFGVSAEAPRADVRRAFLRGLVDEDFVPPETWKPSLDVLLGCGDESRSALEETFLRESEDALALQVEAFASEFLLGRGDDATRSALEKTFLEESEDALALQVEAFASEFSELEPAERRRRYDALASRVVRLPRLAARLRRLEKGLDVPCNWENGLDPDVKDLAARVWVLFLMPQVEAARRRQEFLAAAERELPRWEAAARQLRRSQPALAALDDGLVQDLLIWREAKQRRARARAKPVPPTPAPVPASSSFPRGTGILIAVIIGVIRLAMGFGGTTTPATPPPRVAPSIRNLVLPDEKNWPQMPDPERMKEVNDLLNKPFERIVDENDNAAQKAEKRFQDLVDQMNRTRAMEERIEQWRKEAKEKRP